MPVLTRWGITGVLLSACVASAARPTPGTRAPTTISGRLVWDSPAHNPAAEAWVAIPSLRVGMYTDSLGLFTFSTSATSGCHLLEAYAPAAEPAWHSFTIAGDQRVSLGDIVFESTAIPEAYPVRTGSCVAHDTLVHVDWPVAFATIQYSPSRPDAAPPQEVAIAVEDPCVLDPPDPGRTVGSLTVPLQWRAVLRYSRTLGRNPVSSRDELACRVYLVVDRQYWGNQLARVLTSLDSIRPPVTVVDPPLTTQPPPSPY